MPGIDRARTHDRLEELARRRDALAALIAEDRAQLADAAAQIQRPIDAMQRTGRTLSAVRERYLFLLLPAAVLVLLRPRLAIRAALAGVAVWRAMRGDGRMLYAVGLRDPD